MLLRRNSWAHELLRDKTKSYKLNHTIKVKIIIYNYFAGRIGQGNPRWSKEFYFPKKLYTILSSFGIPSKQK